MKATIFAQVEYEVAQFELDSIKDRDVDIYLHGMGKYGHLNKEDLGGDSKIVLETDPNHALVNVEKLSSQLQACIDHVLDYACENELIIGKENTFNINEILETIKELNEA